MSKAVPIVKFYYFDKSILNITNDLQYKKLYFGEHFNREFHFSETQMEKSPGKSLLKRV